MLRFSLHKIISFCRKKLSLSEIRNGLEASPANEKLQKSIIFWVGCGYLSFGNPFGYENITRQAISKKIWKPNPNQTQSSDTLE